jgi:hypothetical protein
VTPRREEAGCYQPVFLLSGYALPNTSPKTDGHRHPAQKFTNRIFAGSINAYAQYGEALHSNVLPMT